MCRKHGHSQTTFYKLKSKYGSTEVSDAAKLKALEDENAELQRLLADAMLGRAIGQPRRKLALWRYDTDNVRPHSSLDNKPPHKRVGRGALK